MPPAFGKVTASPILVMAHIASAAAASLRANVVNTITITNKSGAAIRLYPLQFGRPFIAGAIPHAPQVLLNGNPVPTQADVKNRYPDGSVEFAVIAVVIPDLRPGADQVLTFRDTTANSNTPLTRAQMLDPSYDFDAAMMLTWQPPAEPASLTQASGDPGEAVRWATPAGWGVIANGGFVLNVNRIAVPISAINFTSVGTGSTWGTAPQAIIQAAIRAAGYPGATFAYNSATGENQLIIPTATSISYITPATENGVTDISKAMGLTQSQAPRVVQPVRAGPPITATAHARTMLANGDYKLWTSGPVAQTIMLADDSPTRKYDIGFGDGYHPFRPRFVAAFWPQTHQVFVRAIGENDKTTELEDLAYKLSISAGAASPVVVYTADLSGNQRPNCAAGTIPCAPKTDTAMSIWTERFWLGGTPQAQVNVNYNLAYLESTRFVANYNASLDPSGAIALEYANYWTGVPHDLYDGSYDHGAWASGMGAPGARQDIGPMPTWDLYWLYTGDWRMRQVSLGMADLAGAWQMNLRETDPSKRLLVTDPAPQAGQTGSGYGLPFSLTDRKSLGPSEAGLNDFLDYPASQGAPASDQVKQVGSRVNPTGNWSSEASHEPAPFFVPYMLTGDPFYLEMMENWAAWDMAVNVGLDTASNGGRGPTGAEGGATDEIRGDGWIIRSRAEAAFAEPDGTPEKTYLTRMLNDDLARWEGVFGVTGTAFDGTAEKNWAVSTGNPESNSGKQISPFGLWGSETLPSEIAGYVGQGIWNAGTTTAFTEAWMQWYDLYAVGRAAELGFAAAPLETYAAGFLNGLVDDSGHPELMSTYLFPTTDPDNNLVTAWPQVDRVYTSKFLTDTNPADFPGAGSMSIQFSKSLYSQGYGAYASAASALVADLVPGAATNAMLRWMRANVTQPLMTNGAFNYDPSWAIVPRNDANTLPAQPTAMQ